MILGLNGKVGAGKTTVAWRLQDAFGFSALTFSDMLKIEVAGRFRPFLKAYLRMRDPLLAKEDGEGRISEVRWDGLIHDLLYVNRDPVARAFLQNYGTDVRRADDEDYWVTQWERHVLGALAGQHIVADGVRFVNEALRIRKAGGRLVRVIRPEHVAVTADAAAHASEHGLTEWVDWDATIVNEGSVPDLWAKVDALAVEKWGLPSPRPAKLR